MVALLDDTFEKILGEANASFGDGYAILHRMSKNKKSCYGRNLLRCTSVGLSSSQCLIFQFNKNLKVTLALIPFRSSPVNSNFAESHDLPFSYQKKLHTIMFAETVIAVSANMT